MTTVYSIYRFLEALWESLPPDALLILTCVGVILFRLLIGIANHARIKRYIAERGGSSNVSIRWTPFGSGWFGDRGSVIYCVGYQDRDGNIWEAVCKTGLFSGVYFTEERMTVAKSERKIPDAG